VVSASTPLPKSAPSLEVLAIERYVIVLRGVVASRETSSPVLRQHGISVDQTG
jgi:hypothetical protein